MSKRKLELEDVVCVVSKLRGSKDVSSVRTTQEYFIHFKSFDVIVRPHCSPIAELDLIELAKELREHYDSSKQELKPTYVKPFLAYLNSVLQFEEKLTDILQYTQEKGIDLDDF